MTGAVGQFGEFVSTLRFTALPAPVVDAAALHALDTLGCGLAGHASGEVAWVAAALDDGSSGRATAIGVPRGVTAADAALVNGTLCHALDFDDTHPAAIVHASAVMVAAALAVGEERGRSGADVLTALVAGHEVAIRLGMAAGTAFHARGLHSTGVCGVFGATATAAWLCDLDAEQTAHALGLAASMASGTLEFLADGAQTKPMHAGWAAHAGVLAARFARAGARGPTQAIEGERGLFGAYLHGVTVDVESQVADLGRRWETPNLAFKLYPACHYIHAALDALAELQRAHRLAPDDVESIVVLADDITIALVLDPLGAKRVPRTAYDAKFSLPHCLAAQLVDGHVDIHTFTLDAIADPRRLAIASRVTYERCDFATAANEMLGGLRMITTDGRVFDAPPRRPRGAPGTPVTREDVLEKYRTNARTALAEPGVAQLEAAVLSLHDGGGLDQISVLRETVQ